jgi:aryl-alcohol dehydrogenase-like predicted oxidoreductase
MEFRRVGAADLKIAPLMLGGNVFGWTADEATSFTILDAFVDAGFNSIDTADVYNRWSSAGAGRSEEVIGAWLKSRGSRDKVVIATKFGMGMTDEERGLSRACMMRDVEGSLRRLRTDYIDIYQSHGDDPNTPQEETMAAFDELIRSGKVRVVGASNFTADRLASAQAVSAAKGLKGYQTLQPLYNLYDRSFEITLKDLCLREGLAVLPHSSLASGFLTGKYRNEQDFGKSSARGGQMGRFLNDRGRGILAALDQVSAAHGATPAQVALAWLMAQPAVTAPIASATGVAQLAELLGSAELKLTTDDLVRLDAASAPAPASLAQA